MQNCVVLHVDDDDASAYILRAAVDEADLKVSVYRVSDGEHALRFLRKQAPYEGARTPKLVLLDLNLPRVDGWQVLEECQKDPALKAIPTIVLSTASAETNGSKALAKGARQYIEKPAHFDELVQQVRAHCQPFIAS